MAPRAGASAMRCGLFAMAVALLVAFAAAENLSEIMGVPSDADDAAIKKAYVRSLLLLLLGCCCAHRSRAISVCRALSGSCI